MLGLKLTHVCKRGPMAKIGLTKQATESPESSCCQLSHRWREPSCTTGDNKVGIMTNLNFQWWNQSKQINIVILVDAVPGCGDPGVPEHGRRLGDDFRHMSIVQFVCDGGFVLEGSRTAMCDAGQWSTDTPRCQGNDSFIHSFIYPLIRSFFPVRSFVCSFNKKNCFKICIFLTTLLSTNFKFGMTA